jgi:hypothetical protein
MVAMPPPPSGLDLAYVRMVKPERSQWPAFGDEIWDRSRLDFGLMAQDAFEAQVEALYNDPEPVLRKAVQVFIEEDTLYPGFQIIDGALSPAVLALFDEALELQVPHNVSAAWMVTPLPEAGSWRPADLLARQIGSFRHSTLTPATSQGAKIRRDSNARGKSFASKLDAGRGTGD